MLIVEKSLKFWRNVPCPSSGNNCPRSLAAPKSYSRYYWWSVSQSVLVYIIVVVVNNNNNNDDDDDDNNNNNNNYNNNLSHISKHHTRSLVSSP